MLFDLDPTKNPFNKPGFPLILRDFNHAYKCNPANVKEMLKDNKNWNIPFNYKVVCPGSIPNKFVKLFMNTFSNFSKSEILQKSYEESALCYSKKQAS